MLIAAGLVVCLFATAGPAAGVEIAYPEGYTPYYNEESAEAMAKLLWAEARGVSSVTEQAAVLWCVINRVEAEGLWSDKLIEVLKQPGQFAYDENAPVWPELYALALDVLIRWDMERCGYEEVGRVLPLGYCWFTGDGGRNYFRNGFQASGRWDWGLRSPYDT